MLTGMTRPRRFPPPWTVEELSDAACVVKDASGQKLGYFYYEEEPGRRGTAKILTKDEARRIAANVAKLKELGIRSVPAVVIDGKLADCCSGGGVDEQALRAAGLGSPF
jgi:glutaredoxin